MADRSTARLSPVPRKVEAPLLHPRMGREEALKAIVARCLDQYCTNEKLLLAGGGSEALHQARVALRQLRSALSLLSPLLPREARLEKQRNALKRLTRKFGTVRELDVLIGRCRPSVHDVLLGHREQAFERLARQLRRRRTRRLFETLSVWSRLPSSGEARLWAGELLDARLARVKRKGKRIASLSAAKRHRLRIEVKKLRYGAEFFSSLYTSEKARRRCKSFVLTLSSLQDLLGELNDLDTGGDVLASYGLEAVTMKETRSPADILKTAEGKLTAAVKSKPFWHGR